MSKDEYQDIRLPKMSEWTCYLFGASATDGLRWRPEKGKVPNGFTRWMMKVCFSCTWVKDKKAK